jgi:putative flavoprotein involved in K+ transport
VARPQDVETVVIGGGQAGLAVSYHLRQLGCEHVVLERGRVGERWKSERWDSFALQGPNWTLQLPGRAYDGSDPDGFTTRDEFIAWLDAYARQIAAPLHCGTTVERLDQDAGVDRWLVQTEHGLLRAVNVVVATGAFERPYIPTLGDHLPVDIMQVPAVRYQNPHLLPSGAVLVVGSGASGCQITQDLLSAGRTVYLAVGLHDRVPRRYRGKDVVTWLTELGEFDRTTKTVAPRTGPRTRRGTGPGLLITGVDGGYTLDIRRYALEGVTLLGHLTGVDHHKLRFADDVQQVLAHGDVMFDRFVKAVDQFVLINGLDAPRDDIESRTPGYEPGPTIDSLDLRHAGITSIVWATGLRREYPWLHVPVLDDENVPVHTRGVTAFPGLFFLGLTWQSRLLSPFINGVGRDAEHVAGQIQRRLARAA